MASPQPVSTTVPESGMRLVVKLSDRHVYLYKDNKALNQYPLAVGQDGWETPTGIHQILDKEQNPPWIHPITGVETPPGPNNPLGKAWIGFWTDGKTEIGFHGTNQEELIGQAVSHGCLRMRNEDIEDLYAQVDVGTPVIVEP
jgi:lipoprotein-anchoring transpeptidase ErfK/SrfK